jgi:hypothetical protein
MNDRNVGTTGHRVKLPDHVHAGGNATHMAIMNGAGFAIDPHLGDPPCGISEDAEGSPGGHLDQATVIAPLQHVHPAVMAE